MPTMTDAAVRSYLRDALPHLEPTGLPERLPEGNLNAVWRVPVRLDHRSTNDAKGRPHGETTSVILKHAPPHIAATPDVPLDPSRLRIEAACLKAFDVGGRLHDLASEALRPPRCLHFDADAHVLVMEDVGAVPTLRRWLQTAGADALSERAASIGRRLGAFIGRLHRRTWGNADVAARFDNRAMQQTRHAVQYQAIGDLLARQGIPDAEALGTRAEAVGQRFLQPGRCLTMGDLWPPSVLVCPRDLRLIDWELAHFGQPEQDVAHVAAHLWMQAHRAPSPEAKAAARAIHTAFQAAYRDALGASSSPIPVDAVLTDAMRRRAAVHFGAEILVRAVGSFQAGYVYDGCPPDHADVQDAVAVAAGAIRNETMPRATARGVAAETE